MLIFLTTIITIMKIISTELGLMKVNGEETYFVVGPNTPEGMKACQIREKVDRQYGQTGYSSNSLMSIAGLVTNPANVQVRTFMVNVPEDWGDEDVRKLIVDKKIHIRAHYQNVPFEDITLKTAIRYAVERGEDPNEARARFVDKQLVKAPDENGELVPVVVDGHNVYRRYELVSLTDNPEAFEDVRKTIEVNEPAKTEVNMEAMSEAYDEQEA